MTLSKYVFWDKAKREIFIRSNINTIFLYMDLIEFENPKIVKKLLNQKFLIKDFDINKGICCTPRNFWDVNKYWWIKKESKNIESL